MSCCHRCAVEDAQANPLPPAEMWLGGRVDPRLQRMFLCKGCGNKRCPHAADHRHACTGSNEPGQPGSRYAAQAIKAGTAETPSGSVHESAVPKGCAPNA